MKKKTDAKSTRNEVLDFIRSKTRRDLENKLAIFGRCALIRCTGFGKTWLLAEITANYEKVLYLYPSKFVKNAAVTAVTEKIDEKEYKEELLQECEKFDFRNIKFMTYSKLSKIPVEDIKDMPTYDLIILDEVHRAGARLAKERIPSLINKRGQRIIGATATPERMDSFDVIKEFFSVNGNEICVAEYTLHDAFCDGILKKPHYCYCVDGNIANISKDMKEAAFTAGEDYENMEVKEVLRTKVVEIAKLYNMPNIVKDVTDKYVSNKDKDYMKYIVFFADTKQLKEKLPEVEKWFATALPEYQIHSTVITSESSESAKNVDKLADMKPGYHKIDLIACIDMLNQGGHLKNLTGIIMYRGTSSSTIYIQQLGRALSTAAEEPCIVFDVVDNLHRKAVYLLAEREQKKDPVQREKKEHKGLDLSGIENIENLTEEERQTIIEQVQAGYFGDPGACAEWTNSCNDIMPQDIEMTGHEATYRELIAKAVAETIAQKCNRAIVEHKRVVKAVTGEEYPPTKTDLINKGLVWKTGNPKEPPKLEDFAEWQQVSVKQVLDHMLEDTTPIAV